MLPEGWEARLVNVQTANTDLEIGYCLEPHDLAASKLVASREKDRPFVATLLRHRLIDVTTLKELDLADPDDSTIRTRTMR